METGEQGNERESGDMGRWESDGRVENGNAGVSEKRGTERQNETSRTGADFVTLLLILSASSNTYYLYQQATRKVLKS